MPKDNSQLRRKQRNKEAIERAERNNVIDHECGNRHAEGWSGCKGVK